MIDRLFNNWAGNADTATAVHLTVSMSCDGEKTACLSRLEPVNSRVLCTCRIMMGPSGMHALRTGLQVRFLLTDAQCFGKSRTKAILHQR